MWIGKAARAACLTAGAAIMLAAAGCESPRAPLEGISVADVQVRRSALVAATALPSGLRDSMLAIVPGCAGDGAPHDVQVEVLAIRRDRSAATNRTDGTTITADVTVVAQETGAAAGFYRVSVSTAGAALPGPPSGNPESVLANLFAAAVCREIFGKAPDLG